MKTKSKEMSFTRNELQLIANGLIYSIDNYGNGLESFKDIMKLLERFNEELDEFTAQDAELYHSLKEREVV